MDLETPQLVSLALYAVVPAIAVATEHTDERINRRAFIGWFLAVMAANFVASVVGRITGEWIVALIAFLGSMVVYFGFIRATVKRARDAGIAKGYCYIMVVPLVGFLLSLVLMIVRGKETPAATAEPPAEAPPA